MVVYSMDLYLGPWFKAYWLAVACRRDCRMLHARVVAKRREGEVSAAGQAGVGAGAVDGRQHSAVLPATD